MDFVVLFDTYGLPITMLIVITWFTYKMYSDNLTHNISREEKLQQALSDSNSVNKEVSETNKGLTETCKQLADTNQELVQQFKTEVIIMKNDIEDIKHAVLK